MPSLKPRCSTSRMDACMSFSDAGKGDTPRPLSVSQEEYDFRWDYAFGLVPRMSDEAFKQKIEEIRRANGRSTSKKT